VRRLQLTAIAHADLKSIRRYSDRRWGREQTDRYLSDVRDTMKRLVVGTATGRPRDDLRQGVHMITSGRHCIFEQNDTRVLVIRVLHERMDFPRHLDDLK
jgi:toxin ParE1/3/4